MGPLQGLPDGSTATGDAGRDAGSVSTDAGGAFGGFAGVWDVAGHDGRGAYSGQVELTPDAGAFGFTRVIHYDAATVEGGQSLWWVWQGTASASAASALSIQVTLQHGDFILTRGALTRSMPEGPEVVGGDATVAPSTSTASVTFDSASVAAQETWSHPRPSGAPIFEGLDRTLKPAAPPLDPTTRSSLFAAFQTYQALPNVQPYVHDPDFQAAAFSVWLDRTDYGFYQAHPNALRVINKVTDDIALLETAARANAFKYSLVAKAQLYDAAMPARFVDPIAGMVVWGNSNGTYYPSGDSALWTGCYVASQAFRFAITGELAARDNLLKSLNALLTLQDITGDPTAFARTLRPTTGTATLPWHQGTGAFAGLDWLETGNNDMVKGLFYGYLAGWLTLCKSGDPAYQAVCAHLQANTVTLATQVPIATKSTSENSLYSTWLAALVTGDATWRIKAEAAWVLWSGWVSGGSGVNLLSYQNLPFLVDWSGTHLSFVGYSTMALLSQAMPLGGGATQTALQASTLATWNQLGGQRLGVLELAYAGLAAAPDPSALADARWRLREIPYPKLVANVDARVNPEFVMSPFPSVPWKNDWTVNNRTSGLRGLPLFEVGGDEYDWKDSTYEYQQLSTADSPGTDYLHAYWFARRYGLLSATE